MRIERPILVPLDRSATSRRLHIELASMKSQVRPDQLLNGTDDAIRPQELPKQWIPINRLLDPPHPRRRRSMALLEIVDLIVASDRAGVCHDPIDDRTHSIEHSAIEDALCDCEPALEILLDLIARQHRSESHF